MRLASVATEFDGPTRHSGPPRCCVPDWWVRPALPRLTASYLIRWADVSQTCELLDTVPSLLERTAAASSAPPSRGDAVVLDAPGEHPAQAPSAPAGSPRSPIVGAPDPFARPSASAERAAPPAGTPVPHAARESGTTTEAESGGAADADPGANDLGVAVGPATEGRTEPAVPGIPLVTRTQHGAVFLSPHAGPRPPPRRSERGAQSARRPRPAPQASVQDPADYFRDVGYTPVRFARRNRRNRDGSSSLRREEAPSSALAKPATAPGAAATNADDGDDFFGSDPVWG